MSFELKLDLIVDWDYVSNSKIIAPLNTFSSKLYIKKTHFINKENKFKVDLKMNFK